MANKNPTPNPKGRPKYNWTWAGLLRKVAEQYVEGSGKTKKELIAEALVKEALKGNVKALKEFGDRIDGKAMQNVEVAGQGKNGEILIKIEDYGDQDNPST